MNHHFLFNHVKDYYEDLVSRLNEARQTISMTFLAFDHGEWSSRIAAVLRARAAAGVNVRLMVDAFGELTDQPCHAVHNIHLIHEMSQAGVQLDVFNPSNPNLSPLNRMHCKFAALDQKIVYLGGSNIGDYYTGWTDTNLRVEGALGTSFHQLYDYLRSFATRTGAVQQQVNPTNLWAGQDQVLLTIPGQLQSIREGYLELIRNARRAIYVRTWYFLPDTELLDALCEQAARGIQVNVLLSHKTRVRLIDFANHLHVARLVQAGGHVHRYIRRYMHAKVAWNERGEVLFGSANLDTHSLTNNFESCLHIHDKRMTRKLMQIYESDLIDSTPQAADVYSRKHMTQKILTRACNLATPWL